MRNTKRCRGNDNLLSSSAWWKQCMCVCKGDEGRGARTCSVSMVSSWKPLPSLPGRKYTIGSRMTTMIRVPKTPSQPTIFSGATSRSAMK